MIERDSRLRIVLAILCGWAGPLAAQDESPEATQPAEVLEWTEGLEAGLTSGREGGKPVLVRAGGSFCLWCRKLEAEMQDPKVQAALASWTLVEIDVEKHSQDAERLGVSAVPALRVLTPGGRVLDRRDGYLPSDELIGWLNEQSQQAAQAARLDRVLFGQNEPQSNELPAILAAFADRDPAIREAAVRRLLPFPQQAAGPVVASLAQGNLSTRLTSLELLKAWKAPHEGLDPWRPESINDARVETLERWAEEIGSSVPDEPLETPMSLSPAQQATVRQEIETLLALDDEQEASAAAHRLLRYGPLVKPLVLEKAATVEEDRDRRRLRALRYRLAADDRLMLEWAHGIERLASLDTETRRQATLELAKRATSTEESLLVELFGDPDTFVRETALTGLKNLSSASSSDALLVLLDDPEPSVRAAVLKQLGDNMPPRLAERIAEYATTEADSDLVVHALRALKSQAAKVQTPLMKLLDHESWRVRAEATEILGKVLAQIQEQARYSSDEPEDSEVDSALADALAQRLDDEDGFVASRAIVAIREGAPDQLSVDRLRSLSDRHPALVSVIVETLVESSVSGDVEQLLSEFLAAKQPNARAAAILGLVRLGNTDMEEPVRNALHDPETEVRTAAAQAIYLTFQRSRPDDSQMPGRPAQEMDRFGGPPGWDEPGVPEPTLLGSVLDFFSGGGAEPEVPPAAEEAPEADVEPMSEDDSSFEWPLMPETVTVEPQPEIDALIVNRRLEPWDRWILDYRAGRKSLRPEWTASLVSDLLPLIAADRPREERLHAALALVPQGHQEQAVPVLMELAESSPEQIPEIASALAWLPWRERYPLYEHLRPLTNSSAGHNKLLMSIGQVADERLADIAWTELARDKPDLTTIQSLMNLVTLAHFGPQSPYSFSQDQELPVEDVPPSVQTLIEKAESGTDWQRFVATLVLAGRHASLAIPAAEKLVEDAQVPVIRRDALRVVFMLSEPHATIERAVEMIESRDLELAPVAVTAIALPGQRNNYLEDSQLWLRISYSSSYSGNQPALPSPLDGLSADSLRHILHESDDLQTRAFATYLLAVQGDTPDLTPLVEFYRDQEYFNSSLAQNVYKAIALTNRSEHVPLLQEIYEILKEESSYTVSDFYWSIRLMDAPGVPELRAQIRSEMGRQITSY